MFKIETPCRLERQCACADINLPNYKVSNKMAGLLYGDEAYIPISYNVPLWRVQISILVHIVRN